MMIKRIAPNWLPTQILVEIAVLLLLFTSCTKDTGLSLRIDTRRVPAIQYMPGEITAILEDLGYQLIPDPNPVKTAEEYGEYRMGFKARNAENIRVDVHIRRNNNVTGIYCYDLAHKIPNAATTQRYKALKKRLEMAFGAENVSDKQPFRTP